MVLDVLSAELERLFELDQLRELSEELLGIDPNLIDGSDAKGSFTLALVQRCIATDAVEALCDAVLALRDNADPKLSEFRTRGYVQPEAVRVRDALGPYLIERKLGEGPVSTVYVARCGDESVRLKLLRREVETNRAGVQRFFTISRLLGGSSSDGLPQGVVAGPAGGRMSLVQEFVRGMPLTAQIVPNRPAKLRRWWPILRQVLEALIAIHARRVAHGSLRPANVLVAAQAENGPARIVLLDAGSDYLHAPVAQTRVQSARFAGFGAPQYIAPEQLRGEPATSRTDVYAFGAILYELLSGRPVFVGAEVEILVSHLNSEPEPLSFVTPRGWVSPELEEYVMEMLDKSPARRPVDAEAVLDVLETIAGHSYRMDSAFPEEELDARVKALLDNPSDEVAAAVLEAAIDQGAAPKQVAETFRRAAERLSDRPEAKSVQKRLLTRSGALYEAVVAEQELAASSYRLLLEADPTDESALAALERVYRRQGKYHELIELLLAQTEHVANATDRARTYAKVGLLLATKTQDSEQALVAYTQALCEDPELTDAIEEIERLAGSAQEAWNEVLSSCAEAAAEEQSDYRKNRLLAQMGHWYLSKLRRPELALGCYQTILVTDPANSPALAAMASIYRSAQHWAELSRVLALCADAASELIELADPEWPAEAAQAADAAGRRAALCFAQQMLANHPGKSPFRSRQIMDQLIREANHG